MCKAYSAMLTTVVKYMTDNADYHLVTDIHLEATSKICHFVSVSINSDYQATVYMHLVSSNITGSVKTRFAYTAQAEHVSKTILFIRELLFPTLHCLINAFNSVFSIICMLSPSLNEKLK